MCKAWLAEGEGITSHGKEATMDGMEVYKQHELNPLWWCIVIFLPLLTTAAMHWVAWK